jgi:hypothetical protein
MNVPQTRCGGSGFVEQRFGTASKTALMPCSGCIDCQKEQVLDVAVEQYRRVEREVFGRSSAQDGVRRCLEAALPALHQHWEQSLLSDEAQHAAWAAIEELDGTSTPPPGVLALAFRTALAVAKGGEGRG